MIRRAAWLVFSRESPRISGPGRTALPAKDDCIRSFRVLEPFHRRADGRANRFAESTPLHVFIDKTGFLPTVTAGGETLATFLAKAMAHPDAVTDHVDEGTLVADYPGVEPFACLE